MKIRAITLILISLLCVGFALGNNIISQNGRDFLTGLLTTVKGNTFKLSDKCLGSDFDKDFNQVIDSINKENSLMVAAFIEKIVSDAKENCPKNDLEQIYKDFFVLYKNGKWVQNVLSHQKDLVKCLKEEINQPKIDALNAGQTVGKMINMVLYNKSHNLKALNFLAEEFDTIEVETTNEDVEAFVDGFFEGVSSVPFDQNKCIHDISNVRTEIVKVFKDLIQAIRTRTDIIEAFEELYELAKKLSSLDANCKFNSLALDIAALQTKVGMAKAVFRVTTHFVTVIADLKGLVSNFEQKLFKESGVDFGSLTKIILNYSTI